MAVKVGTFAKSTDAAPVSQAITGVGFAPKAVILWTANQTSGDAFSANGYLAFGFSDGTDDRAIAIAIQDNVNPTNTGRKMAAVALTMCSYDGSTTLYECELTSLDADGFTLNWTTNNASGVLVHYMALGGPDMTNAKVVQWTCPTTTGNKSVTGVGFVPDCVLHIGFAGTGLGITTISRFNMGAMTTAGQWAVSLSAADAATNNDPLRALTGSRTLQQLVTSSVDNYATYVSMDVDGFTVNFGDGAFGALIIASLCLKGGSYYVGVGDAVRATVGSQSYTGVGFVPEGILMANGGVINSASQVADITLSISATDGIAEASSLIVDEDLGNTVADNAASLDSSTKIITYDYTANQSIDSEADITSFDADGFTINVTTASADTTYPYIFAFNGGAIPGQPTALKDWVRHTGRPWRLQRGL